MTRRGLLRPALATIAAVHLPLCRSAFASATGPRVPELRWLSFPSHLGGLVVVAVTADGHSATALLDTGQPFTVLDVRFAAELGKAPETTAVGESFGGLQSFGLVDGVRIDAGGGSVIDGPAAVADLSGLVAASGIRFDIVLGASAIASTGLTIDHDHERVRFGVEQVAGQGGLTVPLRTEGRDPRLSVVASVAGGRSEPLLLATGSDAELVLGADRSDGFRPMPGRSTDVAVAGGGGIVVERLMTLPALRLGSLTIPDVLARVEPAGGQAVRRGLAGMLGAGLLRRFNVVIDPVDRSLTLLPRRTRPVAAPKSTVGVQGRYLSDRIVVVHVMANSPAERAGMRRGDEICAIDGEAVADGWMRSPMRDWGTRRAGERFEVGLCDGRTVELTSADFY